jgi:hypothetical protein
MDDLEQLRHIAWTTSAAALSAKFEVVCRGPDKPAVLVDQALLRPPVPVRGTPHQLSNVRANAKPWHGRDDVASQHRLFHNSPHLRLTSKLPGSNLRHA